MLKLIKLGMLGIFVLVVFSIQVDAATSNTDCAEGETCSSTVNFNDIAKVTCINGKTVESISYRRIYYPGGAEGGDCNIFSGGVGQGSVEIACLAQSSYCPNRPSGGDINDLDCRLTVKCSGGTTPPQPSCTESCGSWSDRGYNGEECGTQTCHRCNPERDVTGTRICSSAPVVDITQPPANSVYLGSVGGVGNSKCRNAGYQGCVEIQRKNDRGNFEKATFYSCSDNIGASGYYAVCSGAPAEVTPPRDSGLTVSRPVAATREKPLIINFEVTSCSSCEHRCITSGKGNKGVCYSGATLPFDTNRVNTFFVFGNAGCNFGQQCYCYNERDVPIDLVNVASTGMCESETRSADLPSTAPPTTTSVGITGPCSNDNQCESGFCNEVAAVCYDECHTKSDYNQCVVDEKCEWLGPFNQAGGVCANKVGKSKLAAEMAKKIGQVSDEVIILSTMKKIMEDYNLDYGEYLNAWERRNSESRAGIPSPTFTSRTVQSTGNAVRINSALDGCPDFVSNNVVDYDDFFAFVDEFGNPVSGGNEKFDLEKDEWNVIGLGDFFKFADNFGKEVQCFTPRLIEIIDKQGECRDGVCAFKLKAVGKYRGRETLNVNIKGDDYNDKTFLVSITGSAVGKIRNLLTGSSVFDVTGFAVSNADIIYQDVSKPSSSAGSRFECGLQLNPGFCCPAGYQTSSDGSRCVLAKSEIMYCADFNSDGKVDYIDYFFIADNFGARAGEIGYDAKADLDNSGDIGFDDFFLFADEFGKEPSCG